MKIKIKGLPPNINKYIGRKNIWQYQKDKKDFTDRVKEELKGIAPNYSKCNIITEYHFKDKRRRDTHNLTKCLLDALTDAGIIEDDNYQVIKEYTEKGVYDKGKEFIIINIKEVA